MGTGAASDLEEYFFCKADFKMFQFVLKSGQNFNHRNRFFGFCRFKIWQRLSVCSAQTDAAKSTITFQLKPGILDQDYQK